MYLSRLIIRNFRSIKNLDLAFSQGKNVIVGKNNSGKSNIIKALNIVLGESSPTYQKHENVSENDFFAWRERADGNIVQKQADKLQIACFLQRCENEKLNWEEINSCMGYFRQVGNKQYRPYFNFEDIRFGMETYSDKEIDLLFGKNTDCEDPDDPAYLNRNQDLHWIDAKLKNQKKFFDELNNKNQFLYVFRAQRVDGKTLKEIRFLYRENNEADWVLAFSAPVRNELLQSAIIDSFRDPSNFLRVNQWSWFGKLLRNYIDASSPELRKAFDQLKSISDGLFSRLVSKLADSKIKIAFPETNISLQFNPDSKMDIYKSTLIYVDDGFNSQLSEKGSGIQSAVIIGLFDFYCREIAHSSCSLLAIEEPELYLHPQARRIISNRLTDFLDGSKNQVIVTTHSSEFLTTTGEDLNIIVVRKSGNNGTSACNVSFTDSKSKQILLKAQNSEMFFADKVILVEGGDKFVLHSASQYYGEKVQADLGQNWIDDKNVSIIAVGGKGEFAKYYNKLVEVQIKPFILADFDFLLRGLSEFLTATKSLKDIGSSLNELKGKIGTNNFKTITQLSPELLEKTKALLASLKSYGIFILTGELESLYSRKCKMQLQGVDGKEERPIHIVSNFVTKETPITDYIDCGELFELFEVVNRRISRTPRSATRVNV